MSSRCMLLAIALGLLAARAVRAQDLDDVRLEPGFIGRLRGHLGVSSAFGNAAGRTGLEGGGRFDLGAIEARDLEMYVGRAEVSANTAGSGAFGAQVLSIDYAIFEGHSTLGSDGQRVVQTCLWLLNAPCTSGGNFGLALDVLGWQTSLDSGRHAWRIVELDAVASIEQSTNTGWMARRFPLRVGVSVDEVDGISGVSAAWIPRLDVGADARLRFADGKAELDARVRYRPSLSAFVDDFGVEVAGYIGYRGRQSLIQPQGAPLHIGLELGYAYWSIPSHAFGVSWDEVAHSTVFARLVIEPTLWAIH
jgi:hypothetical protein